MSWDKIENHLFYRYDVEGEDKELSDLMEEHDKEVRAKAIDEFAERLNKRLHCAFSDDLEIQKYVNEIAEEMRGAKHEKN